MVLFLQCPLAGMDRRERAPRKAESMKPVLVGFAITLLVGFAFAQPTQQELVLDGEIVSVSAADRTLTVEQIVEPPDSIRPISMQSGVVIPFVVTEETKILAQEGPIALAHLRTGDRVTIHYLLESGENVAKTILVTMPATD